MLCQNHVGDAKERISKFDTSKDCLIHIIHVVVFDMCRTQEHVIEEMC